MSVPASHLTKYPFHLNFPLCSHHSSIGKYKRSANLSYSFPNRDSGQWFVSGFDRCTSRWWGTLPESSRFPGRHIQKNIFPRIMWFSEGRNPGGKKPRAHVSHPKVTGYFLERAAFVLGMVQKDLPSEKGWPATPCHTKHKSAAASPVSLPVVAWLQPAAASGPSRVDVGRDVSAPFHVCQNALCKMKYPIKYPFNACISAQPTRWNTSCRSGAVVLFNVWWTSRSNTTAWNGAGGPVSRLVTWHAKALLWFNGVGYKKSGVLLCILLCRCVFSSTGSSAARFVVD